MEYIKNTCNSKEIPNLYSHYASYLKRKNADSGRIYTLTHITAQYIEFVCNNYL